jgi:hypothetical protein
MGGLGCLHTHGIQVLSLGLMLVLLLVSGGPSFHPRDVPHFIFPWDSAPIASGFVLHATALVASSLGGTVALLSSLFHADVLSSLDSDLTKSFTQAQAFGGHFGPAPDPGYQHLLAVTTPTIPPGVPLTHGELHGVVPVAPGGITLSHHITPNLPTGTGGGKPRCRWEKGSTPKKTHLPTTCAAHCSKRQQLKASKLLPPVTSFCCHSWSSIQWLYLCHCYLQP